MAANSILKSQFPALGGLGEPRQFKRKEEYIIFFYDALIEGQDYLQFLNTGTDHWVVLVIKNGNVKKKHHLISEDTLKQTY